MLSKCLFYDAIRVGAAGAGDFEVERSLRFAEVDPNYLSRNFQSGGNRKKWTFSAWIKSIRILPENKRFLVVVQTHLIFSLRVVMH